MSVKKKLIKNTIVNYGIRLWGWGLTFFLFFYIVRHVGEADYGIYLFVAALIGYFGVMDLGIGNSLIKFVAEYNAKDDKQKMNEVINTTFFIFLLLGFIGGVGLFLIGTFLLGNLANVFPALDSPDFYPKARAILYILGVNFIFGLSLTSLKGILAGLQRYDILAVIAFIMSLVNLGVVVLVLTLGFGIVELVLYTTVTGLFRFIPIIWFIQRLLPYVSIKFSYLNRRMVKVLMDLSISVFLLSIFTLFIYYTDRLVIGLLIGVHLITFYQAAWKLYGIPSKIPEISLFAIIPAASELEAKDNLPALRRLFLRGTKYVLAICLALAVPLIFLSKEMLVWWMGNDYASYYVIVQILTISLFFAFNNFVATQILIGMNKIKKFVKYYGVVGVMNLGLSIFLVRMGFGLTGVALGTTIPFIIMEVFFLQHVFKVLDIKWSVYLKKVIAKTFLFAGLVALLMYGVLLWRTPVVDTTTWLIGMIDLGAYFTLGFGIYMLLFYLYGLEPYEKKEIKYVIAKIRGRINFSGGKEA